ncbi:hypothetical protein OAM01_01535 [bacterium]|nr:hypothetical protein [bacterium]
MIELDLTKHSSSALAPWIPNGFWLTLFSCALLAVLAWGFAWRAVRRSEKAIDLEVFIAFPITHFCFMPLFAWRDWKNARVSVMVYMSVLLVWWFGGIFTQLSEQGKLDRLLADLENQGESLYYPNPQESFNDFDQDNIWSHPFLLPMAQINEFSERGEALRSEPPYKALIVPDNFLVDSQFRGAATKETGKVLFDLCKKTASILSENTSSFSSSKMPTDWNEIGGTVIDYYKESEGQFVELRKALKRPIDLFPMPEQ